jgi:hypothetical protein
MRALILLVSLSGCAQQGRTAVDPPAASGNFHLTCAAPSTANSAQMQCVRTDTRSGDIVVVDYMKLPQSTGPTATGGAAAGRFETACAAPSTASRGEFLCVRLNTETGEMLMINLTKVTVFPPPS